MWKLPLLPDYFDPHYYRESLVSLIRSRRAEVLYTLGSPIQDFSDATVFLLPVIIGMKTNSNQTEGPDLCNSTASMGDVYQKSTGVSLPNPDHSEMTHFHLHGEHSLSWWISCPHWATAVRRITPLPLREVTFSDLQDFISKFPFILLFSSHEISAKRILWCLPQ